MRESCERGLHFVVTGSGSPQRHNRQWIVTGSGSPQRHNRQWIATATQQAVDRHKQWTATATQQAADRCLQIPRREILRQSKKLAEHVVGKEQKV